jgi:hypothetical protein
MAINDDVSPSSTGPLSKKEMTDIAPSPTNPGVRPEELVTGEVRPGEPNWSDQQTPTFTETRGSGTDLNSDLSRLEDPENMQDKAVEDTFPASDAPSHSRPPTSRDLAGNQVEDSNDKTYSISGLPRDFKDNTKAQFEYGRRVERATEHFDRSSHRLERGNPDVGNVDLGTIEADKPVQPDDHDHYDSADDKSRAQDEREF